MASKSEWLWYLLGALLLALQGLITVDEPLYYFGLMGPGWLSLAFALRQGGLSRPRTAVALLIVTNLAFWLSYGLWRLRPWMVGPVTSGSIDPFATAVAMWLVAMVICALYEGFVLVRGLGSAPQRPMSALGLGGVVLQLTTTMNFIYTMIQSV